MMMNQTQQPMMVQQKDMNAQYPQQPMFYNTQQGARSIAAYAGPNPAVPQADANVSLRTGGDQLLAYQLYQQAVNAATPTQEQLNSISGNSFQQTGSDAVLKGGVANDFAPYATLNGSSQLYNSEYQATNVGSDRAESISACAQNAPTFISTSLLPKPTVPGMDSWNDNAPQNILANQNFLSSTQQIGVDTVMSSLRNASHDIRNNVPNPIGVVSPWLNTTITPDLERRPLDAYTPDNGLYSCGSPGGCGATGPYVNQ
jgi:hypothetical protein